MNLVNILIVLKKFQADFLISLPKLHLRFSTSNCGTFSRFIKPIYVIEKEFKLKLPILSGLRFFHSPVTITLKNHISSIYIYRILLGIKMKIKIIVGNSVTRDRPT